jgi:uncharacterized membrane protein
MKLPFFALFCVALFCYCNSTPSSNNSNPQNTLVPIAEVTYTGMYMQGSAGSTFMDCATNTLYTVKDETSSLDTLFKKYFEMREAYDNEPIYAILKGTVSVVPANNGTPSNTQGILMVKKVDSLAHLNSRNCCIPFEYMAYGTEPFWDLKIFPEGKNMVFSVVGDTVATLCTTPPVQTLGDTKTYSGQTNSGKSMKVTIKKGESNDGMSEFIYPYSVEILLGKEKFSGVAMRKGDLIKGME